jgi:hypothetical protein
LGTVIHAVAEKRRVVVAMENLVEHGGGEKFTVLFPIVFVLTTEVPARHQSENVIDMAPAMEFIGDIHEGERLAGTAEGVDHHESFVGLEKLDGLIDGPLTPGTTLDAILHGSSFPQVAPQTEGLAVGDGSRTAFGPGINVIGLPVGPERFAAVPASTAAREIQVNTLAPVETSW